MHGPKMETQHVESTGAAWTLPKNRHAELVALLQNTALNTEGKLAKLSAKLALHLSTSVCTSYTFIETRQTASWDAVPRGSVPATRRLGAQQHARPKGMRVCKLMGAQTQ